MSEADPDPDPEGPEPGPEDPSPPAPPGDAESGQALVQAAWAGTAAFVVSAGIAAVLPGLVVVSLPVALLLFLGGTVAFCSAYLQALQRSRDDAISVADLFFLTECAPRPVRNAFLGALGVMTVVALVTGGVRLYTGLAFGIMAPMWALGLAGLWGARYGVFPPRAEKVAAPGRGKVGG